MAGTLAGATSTWQTQLDSAPTGLWVVPDGTHSLSGGLNLARCMLAGSHPEACTLDGNFNGALLNLSGNGGVFRHGGVRNLTLAQKHASGQCIKAGNLTDTKYCLFEDLRIGAGGIAIELTGTGTDPQVVIQNTFRRIIPWTGTEANGGLLGTTMLKFHGDQNVLELIGFEGSLRTTWVNGSPLMIIGGTGNLLVQCSFDCTWGAGQTGYWLLLQNAEYEADARPESDTTLIRCWFEPHVTGGQTNASAFTSDWGIRVTGNGKLFADVLKFVSPDFKLVLEDTSYADIGELRVDEDPGGIGAFVSKAAGAHLFARRTLTRDGAGSQDDPTILIDQMMPRTGFTPQYAIRLNPQQQPANIVRASVHSSWSSVTTTGGATVGSITNTGRGRSVPVTAAPGGSTFYFNVDPQGTFNRVRWKVTPADATYVVTDQLGNEYQSREAGSLTYDKPPTGATRMRFTFSNLAVQTYTVEQVGAWNDQ